jgi:hypothetical protein
MDGGERDGAPHEMEGFLSALESGTPCMELGEGNPQCWVVGLVPCRSIGLRDSDCGATPHTGLVHLGITNVIGS